MTQSLDQLKSVTQNYEVFSCIAEKLRSGISYGKVRE